MSNPYTEELIGRIENRYSIDSAEMAAGDWLCQNTTLKGKPFSFTRYPFQEQIANDLHPNMDVTKPSQVGLALALDTPIITSKGWKSMGSLKVGDFVFDERGEKTAILHTSPIYQDHPCYEVEFDTGETIIADAGHRWYVEGQKSFNKTTLRLETGRTPKGSEWQRKGVVTTEMLSKNYHYRGRNIFAIPTARPLVMKKEILPIDPYVLGLWLGDGNNASATLTAHPDDRIELNSLLKGRGYHLEETNDLYQFRLVKEDGVYRHRTHKFKVKTSKLYGLLQHLELIKNKHIPELYLKGSKGQRMDLLRGLLDSDGTITKRGRVSFYNTDPQLVFSVQFLISSLGFKVRTRWKKPTTERLKDGRSIQGHKPVAEVSFMAYKDHNPFFLPRKRDRVKIDGRRSETFRHRIVKVTQIKTGPVKCITVDSPSHLFLAGRGMIPTHNSEIQIRKSLAFIARNRGTTLIFTMPNEKMFKRMSTTRIKPLLEEEKVFNLETRSGEKPTRSMGLYQVGTSFMFVTGATEGDATSISADVVMNDETDLTDQSMLALFSSRLQDSDWKINQRFSTPTFANFGVDRGYSVSDQHEYLCKCTACNHWQAPKFARQFLHLPGLSDDLNDLTEIDEAMIDSGQLNLEASYVKCERCRAPLPLGDAGSREWVAKFPSRTHHRGYKVSPFSTDRLPPKYIITQLLRYKTLDYLRGWHNTVLGQAFTDGNSRLSEADIKKCFTGRRETPLVDSSRPTWIGIDMGQLCHVVVAQGESVEDLHIVRLVEVSIKELNSFIQDMLVTYNVIGGACDRHPYTPSAEELFDISQGRILPVEYRGMKTLNLMKDQITERVMYAQANRTKLLDTVARVIRGKRLRFSGYGTQESLIVDHLRDMIRDENPEKEATWVKLTGQDHYFHAIGFLLFGIRLKEAITSTISETRGSALVSGNNATTQSHVSSLLHPYKPAILPGRLL